MRAPLLFITLALALSATSQVPDYVNTDGLIAWFPMDGSTEDYGPNGIVSFPSNALPSPDRMNTTNAAVDLTANGSVVLPNSSFFNDQNEFSVACWMKIPTSFSGNGNNSIVDKGYTSSHVDPYYLFHLGCNPQNGRILWSYADDEGTNFNCQSDAGSWSFSTWFHVAGVINPNRIAIFINGELSAELTGPMPPMGTSNSDVYIAKFANLSFSNSATPMIIDDLGFWTRSLDEAEIHALFSTTPINIGCTEEGACNYDGTATIDDGSCIPSGCMEEAACNYDADAQCEGEACDYTCCPGPGCCGDGMHWDADAQTCVITPPSVAPDTECTLLNLQELAEGYQILLAENAELDSLLADCNGTSTSDQLGPCAGENVVTYHGYDYDIVEIGDQCWFAENLRTSTFNNGLAIANASNDSEWSNATAATYSVHPTSPAYGYYYNGHCIDSDHEVCPTGWHVPSDGDWIELEQFINLSNPESSCFRGTMATKLKATSEDATPWDGSNETGFTAVPSGYRYTNGLFHEQGNRVNLWTSTVISGHLVRRRMDTGNDGVNRDWNNCDPILMNHGFSVRCVKD